MVATSVKYLYERLGAETFQQLVSALLSSQFPRFQAMPLGQADGGRDGLAQVGSKTLIYQVKFSVAGHEKDPVAWLSSILGIRISPVTVLTQMITDHGDEPVRNGHTAYAGTRLGIGDSHATTICSASVDGMPDAQRSRHKIDIPNLQSAQFSASQTSDKSPGMNREPLISLELELIKGTQGIFIRVRLNAPEEKWFDSLWGYSPAPGSTRYRGPEPFVFNESHLPSMWRARSVEVSATTASPVRSGRTGPGKTWKTKALRTVLALGAGLIDNLGRDSGRFK